jgi:histidinol-phosphate aminotransferase
LEYPNFKGIVVVDEAYIDFVAESASAASLIKEYANLCVMQTLSKGFGLAGIRYFHSNISNEQIISDAPPCRLGVALAQPPLIQILSNTKAPYNISSPTARLALAALSPPSIEGMRTKAATLVASRGPFLQALAGISSLGVGNVIGGNDANFVLVPILGADGKPDNVRSQKNYKALAEENGVVVRYRGGEPGCEGCWRITVGTEEENHQVIEKMKKVLSVM